MSKWLVAELVRLLHTISTEEATSIVEELVEREVALVWQRGDKKRVLMPKLTQKQQALILLAGTAEASEDELVKWMEHKNRSNLRSNVLRPMHKMRWVEFDEGDKSIRLLPPGVDEAEKLIRGLKG